MVRQTEIVIAGEVDDLAAVVVAYGGLLVFEDPEIEMGAFGAKFIENCGQMSEVGARWGPGNSLYMVINLKGEE